jgi:hypothetical protein
MFNPLSHIKQQFDQWSYARACLPHVLPSLSSAVTNEELVQAIELKRAFPLASALTTQVNKETSWDYIIEKNSLVSDKDLRELRRNLGKILPRQSLLELGVGEKFNAHSIYFKKHFQVQAYEAVDRVVTSQAAGLHEADSLVFLGRLQASSTSICAFGLFNEPLVPHFRFRSPAWQLDHAKRGHLEHEYLRRIARELYRVVPDDGVFFGDGLHPALNGRHPWMFYVQRVFHQYLHMQGFREDKRIQLGLNKFNEKLNADVFLLRKLPSNLRYEGDGAPLLPNTWEELRFLRSYKEELG